MIILSENAKKVLKLLYCKREADLFSNNSPVGFITISDLNSRSGISSISLHGILDRLIYENFVEFETQIGLDGKESLYYRLAYNNEIEFNILIKTKEDN